MKQQVKTFVLLILPHFRHRGELVCSPYFKVDIYIRPYRQIRFNPQSYKFIRTSFLVYLRQIQAIR